VAPGAAAQAARRGEEAVDPSQVHATASAPTAFELRAGVRISGVAWLSSGPLLN